MLRICVFFAVVALTTEARADFVDRGTAAVVRAIGKSRPSLAEDTRRRWAKALIATAKKHNFDPYTGVAIIHNESRWNPAAVSADGEDFGFGQVRARYLSGCRSDVPAAQDDSASCTAVKTRLIDPAYGIGAMGNAISKWRTACRKITKRQATMVRWLHGYGGLGKLDRTGRPIVMCGMKKVGQRWKDLPVHPLLKRIIDYRKALIRHDQQRRLSRAAGAKTSG